jgi:hypothetical protein
MTERLGNAGVHSAYGRGHYEATIEDNGNVTIVTVFETKQPKFTVTLTPDEWERLVAWVAWAKAENEWKKK